MFYRISKIKRLPSGMAVAAGAVYCAVLEEGLESLGLRPNMFKPVAQGAQVHRYSTPEMVYVWEPYCAGVVVHHGTDAPVPYRYR